VTQFTTAVDAGPAQRLASNIVPRLVQAHYQGLLPVAPPDAVMSPDSKVAPGKVPSDKGAKGWRGVPNWAEESYATHRLQQQVTVHGAGIGINTTRHPFVDVDVTEPELASAIEGALADLLQFPLKRIGRAPKSAIPCSYAPGAEPFPKMVIHLRDAAGQDRGMVEVLSDKRFIVLAGIHPKTGHPYVWHKGEVLGGVELLVETPPESLPQISREWVTERLVPALTEALRPFGVTISLDSGSLRTVKAADVDQESLRAPSLEVLTEVVNAIPNEADHEEYVRMGRAIRAAAGEDHLAEAFALFEQWAADGKEGLGGTHPPDVVWESLRPPHAIGWGYLCWRAREHGFNDGPYVFEADPEAVPTPSLPPYVAAFNEKYALIRQMARVVLRLGVGGPEFLPLDHWRVLTAPEKVERRAASRLWLTHPARRMFRQVTMNPASPPYSAIPVPGDDPDFNIWPGFSVEPSMEGSCELFLVHLRDVVCYGDDALYGWVRQWLAAMVQAPERLTGTALVLRGPMGSGKSYVGEVMGRLLGSGLYSKVSKPEELTGRFNSHHQGKILLQVEEGFFAGNRAAVGALKHMITSDRVRIEGKFRDSYEIPNFCRLLITSNEEWVIPAGCSERRFTVVDISGARKDDWAYHAAMRAQMENGGYAKLLRVLLDTPLDFELLSRPYNTAALRDQQLASLEADQRWLYDILHAGAFPEGRLEADQLYDRYSRFLRDHSAGRRADRAAMGKLLGSIGVRQERVRQSEGRVRVYVFPPLAQCRETFAVGLAAAPEWDGPAEWPEEQSLEALV
jgi:uncharacterized protein DUF5906